MYSRHALFSTIFQLRFLLSFCTNDTCHSSLAVDISDGATDGSNITKDGITYQPQFYFKQDGRTLGCICMVKPCVQKCCPPGQIFLDDKCTEFISDFKHDVYDQNESVQVGDDHFHFVHTNHCNFQFELAPETPVTYYLQRNGDLGLDTSSEEDPDTYTLNEFCIEEAHVGNDSRTVYVGCSERVDIVKINHHGIIGMIISMPFLLATFLAYALLPDRNLPAKALMCYVLSLLLAYILLVTIQLSNNMANGPCVASAILCYFFFMVSFFWMNSSCIDIWLTFSGLKGLVGNRKQNENKRFVYYFIYSWGVPIILVCIVIGMTYGPHITKASQFHTGLGEGQCWFKSELPTGIYFYFPIALLLIINVILFAVTAYKINVVKKDTKMLKQGDSRAHRYENDKQRFNLYLKLLLAMGLNWTMEVISWAVNWGISSTPEAVWYLTDLCNALYGVFIFFIFVFKRNIWMLLKKRYLQLTGKPQQAHQLGISSSTARTAVSQVTSEA